MIFYRRLFVSVLADLCKVEEWIVIPFSDIAIFIWGKPTCQSFVSTE